MNLVEEIYETTKIFPKDERFGLISQMRDAAVSIPSNIAEGRYRGTKKHYCQFLRQAYASGAELETQIEIARRLKFIGPKAGNVDYILLEVIKCSIQ